MLAETVDEAASRFGERPAFVDADHPARAVTYRDLDQRSDAVAAALAADGVGPGDVVALALPTAPCWPIVYAGVAKLGAVTAGINTRLTDRERERVIGSIEPAVVIDDERQADELVARGRSLPGPRSGVDPGDDPDQPVAICFTSGSTGTPRGAVFARRQLAAITRIDGATWGSGGGAALGTTTFAHLGPMTKLAGGLRRGGTTYLMRRWSPDAALALTARVGAATIAGIPTQLALMLADPTLQTTDLSSVRAIVIGGGPATPRLIREARERVGAPVCIRYSCTEAGVGLGTTPDDPPEDAEVSVGRPRGGVEVRIDADGDPVGEVWLRSPAVMSGYHRDPEATARVLTDDGWVRTGDLGRIDELGRLRLTGRASQRYVRGGENVHPQEVEAVLAEHPAVGDVVVLPAPDDVWGQVGLAVVVPSGDPPTVDDLRGFAADRLAGFKLPAAVAIVEALPLGPTHKVDRHALARQLGVSAQGADHP